MRQLTCPPNLEVMGQNIRAFVENLQGDDTTPIVQKYGLANVDPNGWYPAHDLIEALNEIAANPNSSANMVAIGMVIGKIVPMPPGLENPSLGQVLMIWNDLYQFIHRNGDPGAILCEQVNEKHYKTIHSDLYPDDFSYGIVYGYGRRFLPPGTQYKVFYDPEATPRDAGGDVTIIHVSWE